MLTIKHMNKSFYEESYYEKNYVSPVHARFKIANIYYLWLALFCIILPARLKKGSKVLDVGCGVGNLVKALRLFGIDACGIEPSVSAKKFSVASKYCTYTRYKKLPFKSNSFDLVFTNEVLEHIAEKELSVNIKEMLRVSKGKIINMVGVEERGPMIINEPSHLSIHNEKWWTAKFKELGFTVRPGNLFYFFPFFLPSQVNITGIKKGYFFLTHNFKQRSS